jgi:hypothetical protein
MARRINICPPGILCITPSLILLIAVILIGVFAFIYYIYNEKKYTINSSNVQYQPVQNQPINYRQPVSPPISISVENSDGRYMRAPKPQRNWLSPVDLDGAVSSSIPVFATRGLPEAYQSMGIVTTSSGELLPLYGRRVASRSDRFNYYTRTDTNNPIPLPIKYTRRDCQDDVGCDELFDGDSVDIVPTKQNGSVTIYRFNGPTYIPGLI